MHATINTALLAFGSSGQLFHAPFITAHPQFTLYAALERHTKRIAEKYPQVISYNNIEDLLADPQVELVVVNTPNNLHFQHCRQALLTGKHVLVEKPLCATVNEAKELYALANEHKKQLMVYQNRRFDSDYLSFKKVANSGLLGTLTEAQLRFDRYRPQPGPKAFKETPVPASGIQYDLGAHVIDQAIDLFGIPHSWYKTLGSHRPGTQVNDSMYLSLQYPHGLQVSVSCSFSILLPQAAYVLYGTKGSFLKKRADVQEDQLRAGIMPNQQGYGIEQPGHEGTLALAGSQSDENSISQLTQEQGNYLMLYDAVFNTLRNNQPYIVTPQQSIAQLEILNSPVKL